MAQLETYIHSEEIHPIDIADGPRAVLAEAGGRFEPHPDGYRGAADLVEEVARLEGYDTITSVLPVAPAGTGLTGTQRRTRSISAGSFISRAISVDSGASRATASV